MSRAIRILMLFSLMVSAAAPAAAQREIPSPPTIIDLNLMEALVAIERIDLVGIFTFVPPGRAPLAMADFLLRNRKALKMFVKKAERDLKQVQGINEWDKKVFLFLVGMTSGRLLSGIKAVPRRWMDRINTLSLAQPLPLSVMLQRRSGKR